MNGQHSFEKFEGLEISFIDRFESEMTVIYEGVLPNLFKENSGVVATGSLNSEQINIATEILAKHDKTTCPSKSRCKINIQPDFFGNILLSFSAFLCGIIFVPP